MAVWSRFSTEVVFQSPLWKRKLQSLPADKTFKRGNPRFVFLDEIGGLRPIVEPACLIFADPDPDQSA